MIKNKFSKIYLIFSIFMVGILIAGCGGGPPGEVMDAVQDEVKAFLLKIDGNDITYLSSSDELQAVKEKLIADKTKSLKDLDIINIELRSDLTLTETTCSGEKIKDADEAVEKIYDRRSDLSFSVTVKEVESKTISYKTVYENSASHYEGTSVTKTEGSNGAIETVYEVTYVDGNEAQREKVNEKTIKSAQNRVILVGTKKSTASTGSYDWPLKRSIYITSYFGARTLNGAYDYHYGIDFRAAVGTSVYAADGGKVIYAGYMGSYGYLVKIQHDNGDVTYYGHLSRIDVNSGQRVYKGQLIAKSGATGNITGPHLHFEIRKNGSLTDPLRSLPPIG